MIKTILGMICFTMAAWSAPKNFVAPDNSKVPPHKVPAPEPTGYLTDNEIHEMAKENFKAESKRRPSGSAMVATEDMLSPEFVAFRDKIIKAQTGEQFYSIIKEQDDKYDSIPASANDLKLVVARMATWLPLRGIAWKMTPMVHNIVVTQQVLVATLRNIAEQASINFPHSHVDAQMLFLTMPVVDSTGKSFVPRFEVEADFIKFLATDVYQSLDKAAKRIEKIPKMANVGLKGKDKETPIVFDARIRFGEEAFGDNYDAMDRFKVQGEAERFATLARYNRRLAAIASMAAYNWNGHLAARRKIGKEFGVGSAEAVFFDIAGSVGSEYVNGASREKRVSILKGYPQLYTLVPGGKNWMQMSYFHLHKSGLFLEKAWENLKKDDMGYVMQLDPEVFTARREQVEMGIANLKKLVGKCGTLEKHGCDPKVNGADSIVGSLSGEKLDVNLKALYDNPPQDLKVLLPTKFAGNEDLNGLKQVGYYSTMRMPTSSKPDVLSIGIGPASRTTTEFRNYLHGRAIGWNNSKEAYGQVFPGRTSEGVADAMRIINETRGARTLNNAFSMFIR